MKKSSALMFSYIVILILTICATVYSEWNGIEQVALAATAAGLFFACADYFSWRASFNQPMVDVRREYLKAYETYLNEMLALATKDEQDNCKAMELLEPYRNSNKGVAEQLEIAKKLADTINRNKVEIKSGLEDLPRIMKVIEKDAARISTAKYMDVIFTAAGFLAFFMLVVFDAFYDWIMPYGAITTVGAFALIMLTYYAKEMFEAKGREKVEKATQKIQEMKDKLEEFKSFYGAGSVLEDAQKLAATLSKYPNKEDIANK